MSTRENIRLIARAPYTPGAKNGPSPRGHMIYIEAKTLGKHEKNVLV